MRINRRATLRKASCLPADKETLETRLVLNHVLVVKSEGSLMRFSLRPLPSSRVVVAKVKLPIKRVTDEPVEEFA